MSLPSPNLDDRTYDELRQALIGRIPSLCPRWTDFNPSDPGITLLELMAWMAELLLYRINRIPDKAFIHFLELIGVTLRPPSCARCWVAFSSTATREDQAPRVPQGTRLAGAADGGEPVTFETAGGVNLTTARIIAILNAGVNITDRMAASGIAVLDGPDDSHLLYLGDPGLGECRPGTVVRVAIDLERPMAGPVQAEWEVKDKDGWIPLLPLSDGTVGLRQSGEVRLVAEGPFAESEVGFVRSHWLRLRLIGALGAGSSRPHPQMPVIRRVEFGLERPTTLAEPPALVSVSTRLPASLRETMASITDRLPYQPVDLHAEFYPLGRMVQPGNAMYVASPLFGRAQSDLVVQMLMAEDLSGAAVSHVRLEWEYFTRRGQWERLGVSGSQGTLEGEHGFQDGTNGLTCSGSVVFRRPDTMAQASMLGEMQWMIRCRLVEGDYGLEAARLTPGGEPARAPQCRSIAISFTDVPRAMAYVVARNGGVDTLLSAELQRGHPVTPFELESSAQPEIALGFHARMSNQEQRLLFVLADPRPTDPLPLLWEYSSRTGWKHLHVLEDGTHGMSETGVLAFVAPGDWHDVALAGTTRSSAEDTGAFWLRGRLQLGTYPVPPRLCAVHTNAVEAIEKRRVQGEILGASTGEPGQSFTFRHRPLQAQPRIFVEDAESPGESWDCRESLLSSGRTERHCVVDLRLGTVTFGDGRHGTIPALGSRIRADYDAGGGVRGNLPKGSIILVDADVPGVKVTNVTPASGGAEGETLEEAKLRGPATLKHRYRAVTCEDYEQLAREATTEVAKAFCFSEEGGVVLLVVPRGGGSKPRPSGHLVRRLTEYLDARRIVTARLRISGPGYDEVQLRAELVLMSSRAGSFAAVRAECERRLQAMVDPLSGGADGRGWPLGRGVYASEIHRLFLEIPQIDHVNTVRLKRPGERIWREVIEVGDRVYPAFDLQASDIRQV